jgi:hypothetical protein
MSARSKGGQVIADVVVELAHRMPEMRQRERRMMCLEELVPDDQVPLEHAEAEQEIDVVARLAVLRVDQRDAGMLGRRGGGDGHGRSGGRGREQEKCQLGKNGSHGYLPRMRVTFIANGS